jgi:hypothetical protein
MGSHLSFPITDFLSESIHRIAEAEAAAAAEAARLTALVNEALKSITIPNITQIVNRSHTNLSDIGALTHAEIDEYFSQITVANVNTGVNVIDNLEDTEGLAGFWLYSVRNGDTEIRAGIIVATWDLVSSSVPVFHDGVSTEDIGDTSGVIFAVDKVLNTVRLLTVVGSNGWIVRFRRMLLI